MLEIDLSYYDTHHELLLSQGSYKTLKTAARVTAFRKIGKIAKGDFFNYFLIHRSKNPDYISYNQRIAFIGKAVGWIDGVLDTSNTIKTLPGCELLQQHVGEAVCLSVASSLFELTAADWAIIPIQAGKNAHKTFDFERMVTGITSANEIIQVEAKGSFVSDNTQKCQKIYNHSGSISKKKLNIAKNTATYKHPATARYGMIAAVDPVNKAKCWLLDPPAEPFEGDPRKNKAANRLDYVADVISLLAPKALLPGVIRSRAEDWRNGESAESLGAIGAPYTAENYVESYLAKGKIWLKEHDIVGQLYMGADDRIFFIGLLGNVIRNAIIQDMDAIIDTSQETSVMRVTVKGTPFNIGMHKKATPLEVSLILHVTSSGTVIGIANSK
jgi:hypothetical protein